MPVLAVASGGTTAETDYIVAFSLPIWTPKQFWPTVKLMAAMQDSGSISISDMTYTTAEATNSIVLSQHPPITSHKHFRRSERIVKIETIPTLFHHFATCDKLSPAIIAGSNAPREGPISKGSLVLIGISSASALLNPDLTSSLKFRVQDFDNDNNFAYGTIVAGPLSLADWNSADFPEYDSFVRNTAIFSQGSSKLVKDYQNVIQSAKSFADNEDGSVVALLAVRTPNWTGACMVQAVIEYDGPELRFEFEFWEADPNLEIESVCAQDGRASGMMTGGYPLSVCISGFPITYDMEDISIMFGSGPGRAAQVLLLEQSDSNRTKVSALVPPGNPGVVHVVVANHAQGASMSVEFEYLNDSNLGLQDACSRSSCLTPHLQKTIRYTLSVLTDVWKDTQPTLRYNQTTDVRVVMSTRNLMLTNIGRSWLHSVEVRQMQFNETSWLSEGVTLHFVRYNCSQLIALPMGNEQISSHAQSFLRRIAAMIPLSLPSFLMPHGSNVKGTANIQKHSQRELTICSNSNKTSQPHVFKMGILESHRHHQAIQFKKTWFEEDDCGDAILYSVSTEMTRNTPSLAQMSFQRFLISNVCTLTHDLTSCHENTTLSNDELQTVIANLTFSQKEVLSDDLQLPDSMLADLAKWQKPFANEEHEKSHDSSRSQAAGTGLLDQMFGGKCNGQLFLEQGFQQFPMYSQGFAANLVENLSIDKMLNSYRDQDQMHLVLIDKCNIAERPLLANGTVALGLVSNFNCTIKLSFEQLPHVHLLTDTQSQLESELLCPVTAHVYVSPRNVKALDIHTDPYDVFVTQI